MQIIVQINNIIIISNVVFQLQSLQKNILDCTLSFLLKDYNDGCLL